MNTLLPILGAVAIGAVLLWPDGGETVAATESEVAGEAPRARPRQPAKAGSAQAGNGVAQVAIRRAHDGHFYTEAQVNGARIRVLVDTGASSVVLSRADAQAAGIAARPGEFSARGETAGGEIALKPVTIDRLALGPVVAHNVPAVVPERDIGISLLGQSFLERVRTVEISNGEMRLR